MKRFKFTLLSGFIAAVFVFAGIGALALVARAQGGPTSTPSVQTQEQAGSNEAAETNDAAETGQAAEPNEAAETDEVVNLQQLTAIPQADAEAAALTANPGAKVVKTELDNEGGTLAYTVKLDNGTDVMVDANTGAILTSKQDNEAAEGVETIDNDKGQIQVQEEQQSQADDASEAPGVEDATDQ